MTYNRVFLHLYLPTFTKFWVLLPPVWQTQYHCLKSSNNCTLCRACSRILHYFNAKLRQVQLFKHWLVKKNASFWARKSPSVSQSDGVMSKQASCIPKLRSAASSTLINSLSSKSASVSFFIMREAGKKKKTRLWMNEWTKGSINHQYLGIIQWFRVKTAKFHFLIWQ